VVQGFGAASYELGLRGLLEQLRGRGPRARAPGVAKTQRPRGKRPRRAR
jgi:hypothetical protein